jgi:hypothetical protein
VLAYVALGALVVALASPVPVPKPTATNPFNLDPIPLQSLPVIGSTRAKPVCGAIRAVVAPAVQAAMKNDQTYGALRTKIFDYVVKDSDEARDLHLTQMDRTVDTMVKNVDAITTALKSPALEVTSTTKPDDAKVLRELKRSLQGIANAEKTQLEAMSGFVETERMRRFGRLNESETNLQRAIVPNVGVAANGGALPTPVPISGFLRDTETVFNPTHPTVRNLGDAHRLDNDLADIAAFTNRMEDGATRVIVPAANSCK